MMSEDWAKNATEVLARAKQLISTYCIRTVSIVSFSVDLRKKKEKFVISWENPDMPARVLEIPLYDRVIDIAPLTTRSSFLRHLTRVC